MGQWGDLYMLNLKKWGLDLENCKRLSKHGFLQRDRNWKLNFGHSDMCQMKRHKSFSISSMINFKNNFKSHLIT